jgi:predicted RNase H-like HicB family nuclease
MNDKPEIRIFWSDEDNLFIATVKDHPSISAHGDTYEDAAREMKNVIEMLNELNAEQANQWQPISTAPRDNKSFLVYCEENKCQFMVTWCGYENGYDIFGGMRLLHAEPTHWKPTSKPPTS